MQGGSPWENVFVVHDKPDQVGTQPLPPHPVEQRIFRDLTMWKAFLVGWNRWSFFLDTSVTPSPDLELYTDASGSVGFGGYFLGQWFPHMQLLRERGISIEWQELFPIVVACAIWFPHFSGQRVQFWCDNESVVAIINSGHLKAPRIMDLLRFLVLISMKHNFFVRRAMYLGSLMKLLTLSHAFVTHVSGQWLPRPSKPLAPSRFCS